MTEQNSSVFMDLEREGFHDGYPALATWIAHDHDSEAFVFRKFDRLAARNILHMQARLIELEYEIDHQDEEARKSADSRARESSRRWETLIDCAEDATRPERKRVKSLDELKVLLKDYYEILILQSQIEAMRKPINRTLNEARRFVSGEVFRGILGKPTPLISGRAKTFLDDKFDLVALVKPIGDDYLSRFMQNSWDFRNRKPVSSQAKTLFEPSHVVRRVATLSLALNLALAAILLIGAIVTLYSVTNQKAKLGLVAVYTMLFASSVALGSNVKRAELFAATAGYVAVLVVFVSGDLGGSKSEQCLVQLEGAIWKTVRCPN